MLLPPGQSLMIPLLTQRQDTIFSQAPIIKVLNLEASKNGFLLSIKWSYESGGLCTAKRGKIPRMHRT